MPDQNPQNIKRPANKQPIKKAVKPVPQKISKADQTKIFKGLVVAIALLLIVLLGVRGYLFFKDETDLINREVTIEAGTTRPDLNMFLSGEPTFPQISINQSEF